MSHSRPGSSVGDKVVAAGRVARGLGDAVRGTVLSTVDDTFHGNSGSAESRSIAERGMSEYERGMAVFRGRRQTASHDPYTYDPSHDNYRRQYSSEEGYQDGMHPRRSQSLGGRYSPPAYERHQGQPHYSQGYQGYTHEQPIPHGTSGPAGAGDPFHPAQEGYGSNLGLGRRSGDNDAYGSDPYGGQKDAVRTTAGSRWKYEGGNHEVPRGRPQGPPSPEQRPGYEYGAKVTLPGDAGERPGHHRDDAVTDLWPNPANPAGDSGSGPGGVGSSGLQRRPPDYGNGSGYSGAQPGDRRGGY